MLVNVLFWIFYEFECVQCFTVIDGVLNRFNKESWRASERDFIIIITAMRMTILTGIKLLEHWLFLLHQILEARPQFPTTLHCGVRTPKNSLSSSPVESLLAAQESIYHQGKKSKEKKLEKEFANCHKTDVPDSQLMNQTCIPRICGCWQSRS